MNPFPEKLKDNIMFKTLMAGASALTICSTAALSTEGYRSPVTIPEQLISDLQADLDIKEFQAAGVAGNLARETGNFRYIQELNPLVEESRGGLGYSQWTASRRDSFVAFADGRDVSSYRVNYDFLVHELTSDYADALEDLRQTATLEDATAVFMEEFLSPSPDHAGLTERIGYAEAYLSGDFSEAGCLSHHDLVDLWGREALALCPKGIADTRPRARPDGLVEDGADEVVMASLRPRPRPDDFFEKEFVPTERTLAHIDQIVAEIDTEVVDPFSTLAEIEPERSDPSGPG